MSWSLVSLFAQANTAAVKTPAVAETSDAWVWLLWVVAFAVVILPFVAGNYLSKAWRMPEHAWRFGMVLFAVTAGLVVCTLGWQNLRLGIDLSGGVILVYELEDQQNKDLNIGNDADRIRRRLQSNIDRNIEVELIKNQIFIRLPNADGDLAAQAQKAVSDLPPSDLTLSLATTTTRDGQKVLVYDASRAAEGAPQMDKLVGALNKRINPGGQKEVVVRRFGDRQVEIIIPKVAKTEIDLIKQKISTSGVLEFRIVANSVDHAELIEMADRNPKSSEVVDNGKVRAKWVKLDPKNNPEPGMKLRSNRAGETEVLVYVDGYNVTGDYLNRASANFDSTGRPSVGFSFNTRGAALFGNLTGENLPDQATGFKRQLGIILDGRLVSAPNLKSAISSEGTIEGRFSQEEVDLLVEVLNAGHLPATLHPTPVSETNISPQLGEETIRNGAIAMGVSTLAILLFMGWYYRFAGMVANIAVLLNVLLVVSLMILLKAAFTLAGLAGLVLSVGMAVDANVLIFERMREEMQRGAALRMAIRNGFGRAMSTIIDSNTTTLISAVVLYAIGTDQLKGFAITLILGLLLNLFTAVFVTRVIFDVAERRRWITKLNMVRTFSETKFDFVKPVKVFVTASLLIIAVGIIAAVSRGAGLFDIDFTGGTSLQIVLKDNMPLNVNQVRTRLGNVTDPNLELEDVSVSSITSDTLSKDRYYKIDTSNDNIEDVQQRLIKLFPELQLYEMTYAITKSAAVETPKADALKPDAAKSDSTKPEATKTDGKQDAVKQDDSKQDETKSGEAKSGESKSQDAKQDDAKQDATPTEGKSTALLPAGSLLSLVGADAVLLLQAEDTKSTDTKSADEDTKSDAAKSDAAKNADSTKGVTDAKAATPAVGPALPAGPLSNAPAGGVAMANVASTGISDPFAGGTTARLTFAEGINREALDNKLKQALGSTETSSTLFELESPEGTGGAAYQQWILRTTLSESEITNVLDRVKSDLAQTPVFRAANKIGGRVAGRTQDMAIIALIASMLMIILYVWFRFQNVVFGVAAVTAVFHDVLIAASALAVSAYIAPYFGWALINPFKISLDVVAALLTIIGFSINDTIVIFDRIREIRGKSPDITADMVNKAVNQTLGRTIITSGTVLIVTIILYIMGGQEIHPFAFTMLIGIISGTYSTVFIAAPMVLWFRKRANTSNRGRMMGERTQTTRV